MKLTFQKRLVFLFGLTISALLTVGVFDYLGFKQYTKESAQILHTQESLNAIDNLLALITDAETGQRGYVITGDSAYLEPYYAARPQIFDSMQKVKKLIDDNDTQQNSVSLLVTEIQDRLKIIDTIIDARKNNFESAQKLILAGEGIVKMTRIRSLVKQIETIEQRQLAEEMVKWQNTSIINTWITVGGVILSIGIIILMSILVWRENQHRMQAEASLESINIKLQNSLQEMQQFTSEMKLMNAMSDMLQSCRSMQEANTVISRMMPKLLVETQGALCLLSNSRDYIDIAAQWHSGIDKERLINSPFSLHDCLALRRGRPYWVEDTCSSLQCQHLTTELPASYCCIPMMAHGDTIGLLFVAYNRTGTQSDYQQRLIETLAEQLSLTLANLKLQETLRVQSIRDPLTGLYNRRYLEASLERELMRAQRNKHPVSVIMLDIDHFKQFNDEFGHEAGDTVLVALAELLKSQIRSEDIPCRYGGEEFNLILPEATLQMGIERAEQLREKVGLLSIDYLGKSLGKISLSLGVAVFPSHGETGDELIRAADAALYRAKNEGRDRVCVAEPGLQKYS